MKKSRIIIPALAMIAFSVAASITGTVAWFTANRTATIDAGTYAVVKTTADLTCTVTSGIGTTGTNSGSSHTVSVDGKLTDGSFDHANKYIYAPSQTGSNVGAKIALASATADNLKRGQTSDSTPAIIYTAVTWDMKFTVNFGAASGDVGLFMDLSSSVFTPSSGTVGENNQDTAKGFRMAFVPKASGVAHVFADLQTAANCTYIGNQPAVGAALPDPATSYTGLTLIDSASTGTLAESYTASEAAAMNNYFGTFTYTANTAVDLEFTVVCWFEGTDANIVNGDETHVTIFRDVTASLTFNAINLTA